MKLFLSANPENAPTGYVVSPIVYGHWSLDSIPDGSCSEIMIIEGLEYVYRDKIQEFLKISVSKLRREAIMTLVGIDFHELVRAAHARDLTADQFNDIVLKLKSINAASETISALKDNGLSLISYKTKGLSYDIKAARK
jgi:hypothetical protein